MIKCHVVKALSQNEDFRNAVAPATGNGSIVTARAGVGFGGRHAIKVSWKRQCRTRIGQRCACSLRQRPPRSFLDRKLSCEELLAISEQLRYRSRKLLAVS